MRHGIRETADGEPNAASTATRFQIRRTVDGENSILIRRNETKGNFEQSRNRARTSGGARSVAGVCDAQASSL